MESLLMVSSCRQAEKEIAGLQNQRKKNAEETIALNKQLTGDYYLPDIN